MPGQRDWRRDGSGWAGMGCYGPGWAGPGWAGRARFCTWNARSVPGRKHVGTASAAAAAAAAAEDGPKAAAAAAGAGQRTSRVVLNGLKADSWVARTCAMERQSNGGQRGAEWAWFALRAEGGQLGHA